MTIAIKSGLVQLVADVRAYLAEDDLGTEVRLGWKEATKQINQGVGGANRVVFTPSDPSGKGGKLDAIHQPGPRDIFETTIVGGEPVRRRVATVRGIYNCERVATVSVWAVDKTDPASEELQIEATETLLERTLRACRSSANANFVPGEITWLKPQQEHLFGREVVVAFVLRHPFFDRPNEVVFPDFALSEEPPRPTAA